MKGAYISYPATIESVNDGGGCNDISVDIKIMIQPYEQDVERGYLDTENPIIKQVPLMYISTARHAITVPVQVGDQGVAFFSGRDLSNWKTEELNQVPVFERRENSINDAYFMPALWQPLKGVADYDTENISIRNIDNTSSITVGDEVAIKSVKVNIEAAELNFKSGLINVNGNPWLTMNPPIGTVIESKVPEIIPSRVCR